MAQAEAPWWADVQHLREDLERRRGGRFVRADGRGTTPTASFGERPRAPGTRRTVRIRGQAIPAVEVPRLRRVEDAVSLPSQASTVSRSRRPPPRVRDRLGASPDRLAMWAFAFAVMMLLAALLTGHA